MRRKTGVPSEEELLNLSSELGSKWKNLARALGIPEANIEVVEEENRRVVEKCYSLLLLWKQGRGAQATYEALEAGLCHGVVLRRDLAERYKTSLDVNNLVATASEEYAKDFVSSKSGEAGYAEKGQTNYGDDHDNDDDDEDDADKDDNDNDNDGIDTGGDIHDKDEESRK